MGDGVGIAMCKLWAREGRGGEGGGDICDRTIMGGIQLQCSVVEVGDWDAGCGAFLAICIWVYS